MSFVAMSQAALSRSRKRNDGDVQDAAEEAPSDESPLQKIVRYIPSEAITLYVVAVAAVPPIVRSTEAKVCETVSFTPRWWLFGAFALLLTPLLLVLIHANTAKQERQPFRLPRAEMAIAVLAFSTWAFAIPETPFEDFCWYDGKYAAFLSSW